MKLSVEEKIKMLEDQGWTVELKHRRNYDYKNLVNFGRVENVILPKGGYTVVLLTQGETRITGEAICSMQDNYNKRIGAHIALGRAIKQVEELKGQIWPVPIPSIPEPKESDGSWLLIDEPIQ